MVAGSATTRGVAALFASTTGAAGTISLFAELQRIGTDVEEPTAKPCGIEEWPEDWQADDRQH